MDQLANKLFKPGFNCWRTEKADHASVIVDYGNYYRDLHEAISQAKHSIFLLGWDIDSRMELLRGEEAEKNPRPHVFFDLIQQKARENPNLMIYLDRWNYSMFFLKDRESLSEYHWRWSSPPNVHFCLDTIIPYGACHHQKIAVIDDSVAFCGGMDVALGRWDFREHHPHNHLRKDPGGTFTFYKEKHFGPYHDIMISVSGGAARALAELARTRWKLAAGFDAIPLRAPEPGLPSAWPASDPPDFYNAEVAISLTVPPMYDTPPIRQAEHMYIDLIEEAENFIYMENQFFSHVPLAEALKKRLIEKPNLRVLMMSCFEPQGIMEKK
ncbi:MAG TPA: phospholipase, partial [Patescibacteria group bacterium]|nr:phospholipase [Patescibacteria group bacterium]